MSSREYRQEQEHKARAFSQVKQTRVRKGDKIPTPCEGGGWRRAPAPYDGVLIEQGDVAILLSMLDVQPKKGRK